MLDCIKERLSCHILTYFIILCSFFIILCTLLYYVVFLLSYEHFLLSYGHISGAETEIVPFLVSKAFSKGKI